MQTATIILHPRLPQRRTRLARLGDWMARHRRAILAVQWVIVVFYLVLVALPAFLPHPHPEARLFSSDFGATSAIDRSVCTTGALNPTPTEKAAYLACWQDRLVLLAQYLFWGVWWPFVILSIMLMGRVWCGVLCPEGALAEFASRHGRGGAIPKWMRWGGWPVVAFILTTVYGQLVSVYDYPQAALLILGGSTVAAVGVGWMYGKGKRVWCRYLCPVSGVFSLLARIAPVHFRIDRAAWDAHPQRSAAVDCAPLLDVKHMKGAGQCHACGRCSGHRDAVTLAVRSPNAEILDAGGDMPRTNEAVLLLFGMLGVAMGAFQWTVNPWFVRGKQAAADWLVARDILWPLGDSPAWWLLTRYPEAGDVFTWLDGAAILIWISMYAIVLGGFAWLTVRAAAHLAGVDWRRLALGLVPLAGIGLFLGLSMMSATHLRAEGVHLGWLTPLRAALLVIGLGWSASLGWQLVRVGASGTAARGIAGLLWLLPLAAVGASWWLTFFVW
ncbi:4Fe-4S binding protein [Sulfuritalea hydrogenivorans]|jgi:polyferredoxin|uniref:Regulatory protein n=1 Tax=Sulfuritalea hydrogenivorans sk43H TaxID=1223802 RepID=W0SC98_9PROT|nr:4Fe-4S binding protein [Sulfuritalea hydrogenivorans]MDK9715973.1 4Fe-4S binding protein [Sulfuritalea sp.]BAO28671.1 regulatory protein [Sulfuritalea hydrogenivorans sk43H]